MPELPQQLLSVYSCRTAPPVTMDRSYIVYPSGDGLIHLGIAPPTFFSWRHFSEQQYQSLAAGCTRKSQREDNSAAAIDFSRHSAERRLATKLLAAQPERLAAAEHAAELCQACCQRRPARHLLEEK